MDVLTVGRVIVDLYANELHRPLEDVESFSKYLGGSAANIAVGLARLGQRCGLISRVGDDGHGRFLRRYLEENGVDTRLVGTDPRYRTGLAFAAIFPPQDSRVLFYRDPCADTEVHWNDLDPAMIYGARMVIVTGTALAKSPLREAVLHLLRGRRRRGLLNVMDIDYRPVLWRDPVETVLYYDWAVRLCDVLIGNEAEIAFAAGAVKRCGEPCDPAANAPGRPPAEKSAPGRDELEAMARALLRAGVSQVVVKLGAQGSMAVSEGGTDVAPGFPVQVVNTLGAGDGFAAGFCSGVLWGWPAADCLTFGNAVGAIVVSRHGCAPAIPTLPELKAFLADRGRPEMAERLPNGERGDATEATEGGRP
ncbi:MAG: 5-dehydro-2-deoxygluconokinase [Firmicutes bacterium]|nr:5-dehydro-2-deoxygluconokinase [Bacillota bacterium]